MRITKRDAGYVFHTMALALPLLLLVWAIGANAHFYLPTELQEISWLAMPALLWLLTRKRCRMGALVLLFAALICYVLPVPPDYSQSLMEPQVQALDGQLISWHQYRDYGRGELYLRSPPAHLPAHCKRLQIYSPQPLTRGLYYRLRVRTRAAIGERNRDGFDREAWLVRRGICQTASVLQILEVGDATLRVTLRDRLRSAIDALTPEPDAYAPAMLAALLIGERGRIDVMMREAMQSSGTAHLLAVSGLHVAVVAGWAWLAMVWLMRPLALVPRPWLLRGSVVASLLIAAGYASIAGWHLPIQRALAAAVLAMLPIWLHARLSIVQRLLWALAVVVLIDPLAPLGVSLWLSFSAVSCIAWHLDHAERQAGDGAEPHRWQRYLKLQVALSLVAGTLQATFFGEFPLASPLFNLILVPLFSILILPLAMMWAIGQLVGLELSWLGVALVAVLDAVEWLLLWLPMPTISIDMRSIQALSLVLPLALAVSPVSRWRVRLLSMIALLAILIAPWRSPPALHPDAFVIEVLDVGQGLAVLIYGAQETIVFDAGRRIGAHSHGSRVVIPRLQALGRRATTLIASHGDSDHFGGFEVVADTYPNARRFASRDIEHLNALDCRHRHWRDQGLRFTLYQPRGRTRNDRSCVLHVASRSGLSAWIVADIEADGERWLLRQNPPSADLLLVPHHGSATSSNAALIDDIDPLIAVVSRGPFNRYGHPHPEVRARYLERDTMWFDTACDGAMTIEFAETGRIRIEREATAVSWRWPRSTMVDCSDNGAL
ncbi:DNA internalization-related competence protein ComEC/Rec2 [Gammaproteobacteria bacterium]|nr:DNA internalization-related competence protein ComEC/Rec2 [Gammaproteobacteria bacterium]